MRAGVTEAKAALRQQISSLPPVDWQPLLDAFLALPEVKAARTILLFYGVGREPDTTHSLSFIKSKYFINRINNFRIAILSGNDLTKV